MSCCQNNRRDVGSVWCVARFIVIANNAFGDETGKKTMPWLQMSRFLWSSGFDQSWHWLCTVNWLLAHMGKTQLHLASHSRCMIYNENFFFTFPIMNVAGHAVISQLLTTCITKHIIPEYGSGKRQIWLNKNLMLCLQLPHRTAEADAFCSLRLCCCFPL